MVWENVLHRSSARSGRDANAVDIEKVCDLFQQVSLVPDAQGKVVRGTRLDPAFQKSTDVGCKAGMRVGIPCRRNGTRYRFSLGNDKAEFSVGSHTDTENGKRTSANAEFDTGALAGFAMIFLQTANDRPAIGYVEMMS